MIETFKKICKCGYKTGCKCVKCVCCKLCKVVVQYAVVGSCCCVVGMVTMLFIFFLYYGIFYPAQRTAALEHTGMYDYDQGSRAKSGYLKKDVKFNKAEEYGHEEYYYDSDDGDNDVLRNKRNLSVTSSEVTVQTTLAVTTSTTPTTPTILVTQEVTASLHGGGAGGLARFFSEKTSTSSVSGNYTGNITCKPKFNHSTTHAPPTAAPYPDDHDPDFHLGNAVMDAVFSHAESTDMKQTLGLCRKNADIKLPQFKATLFPAEQAADILSCINDLLRNQTKRQICLHLDPEMNAYLKWLLLTGDSKEKHKPVKMAAKEDFLFPSSCECESAQTPECLVEPVVRDRFEE